MAGDIYTDAGSEAKWNGAFEKQILNHEVHEGARRLEFDVLGLSLTGLTLQSPKFCRHAGLDPASRFIILLELFWIPAFAGMTSRMNQQQEYQGVKKNFGLSS